MQLLEFVPEEFRDRAHLQQIRRRLTRLAITVSAVFVIVAVVCLFSARHGGGLSIKVGVPLAAALSAFALFSLIGQHRKLLEVDPNDIMTFIESCDRDPTGLDSAKVSGLVAELYAGQGFMTQDQFARITAMLHGQMRSTSGLADLHLPFDENHELA